LGHYHNQRYIKTAKGETAMSNLEDKAKTIYELMQKRKEWLEDFSAGALGNQEAYARARDNRSLYEQGVKYVPVVDAQKREAALLDQLDIVTKRNNELGNTINSANKILLEKLKAWRDAYSLEANDLQAEAIRDLEEVWDAVHIPRIDEHKLLDEAHEGCPGCHKPVQECNCKYPIQPQKENKESAIDNTAHLANIYALREIKQSNCEQKEEAKLLDEAHEGCPGCHKPVQDCTCKYPIKEEATK
jgi:hypothetical protein